MASTFEPIGTSTLTSSATNFSVTFSSIPSTYTDLRVVVAMQTSDSGNDTWLNFNGDSASNYGWRTMEVEGSNTLAGLAIYSSAQIRINNWQSYTTANKPVLYTADILNYTNTTGYKTTLSKGQGSYGTYGSTGMTCGIWRNTAAITSLTVFHGGTVNAKSTFTLYGIKAA